MDIEGKQPQDFDKNSDKKKIKYSLEAVDIFLEGLRDKYLEDKDRGYLMHLVETEGSADLLQLQEFKDSVEEEIKKANEKGNRKKVDGILDFYRKLLSFEKLIRELKQGK